MDIHRRSSVATDATAYSLKYPSNQEYQTQEQQQPVFIPGSSLDSAHSLAMSAPANTGYDYGSVYPTATTSTGIHQQLENNSNAGSTSTSLAKSFEEDYTVQMK
jgi:hypothetical protein